MSATELRQAAEAERAEWGTRESRGYYPTPSAIHLAVADLLDAVDRAARRAGTAADLPEAHSIRDAALALARLINGGAS
jgi:hypothetical protein